MRMPDPNFPWKVCHYKERMGGECLKCDGYNQSCPMFYPDVENEESREAR